MSTLSLAINTSPVFCLGTYKDRNIATYQVHGGWVVYLDDIMQHNLTFATASDGLMWLRRRVDYPALTRTTLAARKPVPSRRTAQLTATAHEMRV